MPAMDARAPSSRRSGSSRRRLPDPSARRASGSPCRRPARPGPPASGRHRPSPGWLRPPRASPAGSWCRPDRRGGSPPRRWRRYPDRPHARACRPAGCGHPSSWRSWPPGPSARSSPRWTAACLCAGDPAGSGPRPSASRCRFPRQTLEHLAVAFAAVAADDRAQRRIGLHRRQRRRSGPCAEHARQLGGESPLPSLIAMKG